MGEVQIVDDQKFNRAVEIVLRHEGRYVVDNGGPTNFGVSLRYAMTVGDLDKDGQLDMDFDHDGDVDAEDIKKMTREDAKRVYRTQWWDRYGYGAFPDTVAFKLLDLSVNMGPPQAHKLLQRAINNCDGQKITVDGEIGERTVAAAQACPDETLLAEFRRAAVEFYLTIIAKKPSCLKYKKGWMRRGFA